MKKYIFYLSIIALTLSHTSCENFLDSPNKSTLEENIIFSDPTFAEGAVFGIYNVFLENNSYRNRLALYMGVNTDIELHSGTEDATAYNDRRSIAIYNTSSNNTEFNASGGDDPYSRMYSAIERANICISGIRKYGSPEPGTKMGYLLGESLALRAFLYADLVKWWGDVPARFEPVASSTIYTPKSDRDVIYKQIIADLAEADALVPWPGDATETKTVERVNKAFVKGLRARICLAAGGYSLRPDAGIRLSTDPELSRPKMYAIAKKECQDIIESKKCNLSASFEAIFKENCQDVVSSGRESIFELPYSSTRGQMVSYCGLRHDNGDKYTTVTIKGEFGPSPVLYYDYDTVDTRRDVTCIPYKWKDGKQQLTSVKLWYFGKYRAEWMTRVPVTSNDDGVNPIMLRYADVLLMFAEAENELNGPTDSAKLILKAVRGRAFPESAYTEKVDNYINALTDKNLFFDAVVKERAFEFAGEQVRKYDLIRWNLLKNKLDDLKANVRKLRDGLEPYADVPKYVFWKFKSDKETIEIFGLKRGQVPKDGSGVPLTEDQYDSWRIANGWNNYADSDGNFKKWVNGTETTGDLQASYIDAVYLIDPAKPNVSPDTRQLMPFMDIVVSVSNGMLSNDYGY
jgi:hypothetical protein